MRQQQEVVEEEGPQLPGALGFLQAAAVQQLARAQAVGQRVKRQVLERQESNYKVVMCAIFSFIFSCFLTWVQVGALIQPNVQLKARTKSFSLSFCSILFTSREQSS